MSDSASTEPRDKPGSGAARVDAGGFRFNATDDTLDLARGGSKTFGRRTSAQAEDSVCAYLDGRAYLELEFRSVWPNPSIVKKASGRPPFVHGAHRHAAFSCVDTHAVGASVRERHYAMCAAVPKLIECPDGPIASLACIFAQHEGDYVFVNVFAAASIEIVLKAAGGLCDQEFRAFRVASEQDNGASVYSVIEGITKVTSDSPDIHADLSWDSSGILDVEKVLASFTVQLGSEDPVLMANKGFYAIFETGDAFLRLIDYHSGAVEGIIHA